MSDALIAQEFLSAVYGAHDEMTFGAAASRLADGLGFRWFTYLSVGGAKPAVLSTYPAIWSDHYLKNAFEQIDPVVASARDSNIPFFWGSPGAGEPHGSKAARLLEDAASFGIVSGLTVPFQMNGGRVALFTLSTDEASTANRSRADGLKTLVQVCALHLHNELASRIERFRPDARAKPLSRRQSECLLRAAEGQTAKTIARATGIAARTVELHWEQAKRRLDADTLPQAVASAFRKGWIS